MKKDFKLNPTMYYAMSVAATWAGIGSLMNGILMTQTNGAIPAAIWVFGNVVACMVFAIVTHKVPKVREVFGTKVMKYICAFMCVFQAWLSMNGMQTVFADTVLGSSFGTVVAYVEAVFFLIILFKFGMIRNVLTDNFGWIIVYALAIGVTIVALVTSNGQYNAISAGLDSENMKIGIWKAILLIPGPFTYPYFFELISYNEKNEEGVSKIDTNRVFMMGGVLFGVYMLAVFPMAWAQFSPALNLAKAVLITIIGTSTLSSSMYSIYIAFGKKWGCVVNTGLVAGWSFLIPLGVMGMWTFMASVRIYFVGAGILAAIVWHYFEKKKCIVEK